METNTSTYDVILEDPLENVTTPLAEALTTYKKIPFQDAAFLVRQCWGFLLTGEPEKNGQDFISLLLTKNIHARLVRTQDVSLLSPVKIVKELGFAEKSLTVRIDKGGEEIIGDGQGILVAASCIPLRTTTITKVTTGPSAGQKAAQMGLMALGIPLPIGKKQTIDKKETKEEPLFYLDILTTSPANRYQIDAQHFSFAFLKELKQYNIFQNFKITLSEILKRFPGAALNKGARLLLKNEPYSKMNYESMADAEKEIRGLFTLLTLKSNQQTTE